MRRKRSGRRKARGKDVIDFHRGHKISVPNHPPEFCSIPWFALTVRYPNPGTLVTTANISNAIQEQLGTALAPTPLNIRLLSVRLWGPIPVTNNALVLRILDTFQGSGTGSGFENMIVEQITDFGDQVNRARCGYRWSTAQQQRAIFAGGSAIPVVNTTGAGPGSVMYFNLLWRPWQSSAPPALSQSDDETRSLRNGFVMLGRNNFA